MADIKIELDPITIQKELVTAIVNSGIGQAIAESVKRVIPNITSTWDNGLDKITKEIATQYVRELVNTSYKDKIEEAVKIALTPERLNKIVQDTLNNLTYSKY